MQDKSASELIKQLTILFDINDIKNIIKFNVPNM